MISFFRVNPIEGVFCCHELFAVDCSDEVVGLPCGVEAGYCCPVEYLLVTIFVVGVVQPPVTKLKEGLIIILK